MNRRQFFGGFATAAVGAAIPAMLVAKPEPPQLPRVSRADGKAFMLGVATETVQAGDVVQIQTRGQAEVPCHTHSVRNLEGPHAHAHTHLGFPMMTSSTMT